MSRLELSDLQAQSFAEDRPDSRDHALELVGTPACPSFFADLAALALKKEPNKWDCPGPLPRITDAVVFTTARHAIPYGDAFTAFWETVNAAGPDAKPPVVDIVDPSILKYPEQVKGSHEKYEATRQAQLDRIASLAREAGGHTIAYVFDEFVIEGRAIKGGVRIVKAAGFPYVSKLPLHAPMGEDGVYISSGDLPLDRERSLGNQLVPNDNTAAVEALRHDMTLIGSLAGQNYLEFTAQRSTANP